MPPSACSTTVLPSWHRRPTAPICRAGASYGQYLLSKTKDAFEMDLLPKDGQAEAALKAAFIEARRAAEFGFTATEYQRYKQNFHEPAGQAVLQQGQALQPPVCQQYVQHFLDNEPIPSIDDYYQMMKQLVPMLPVEAINQLMQELVTKTDSNMVVLNMNQEKDGAVYPTEESLKKAIDEARATQIEAYVDNVKDEPLITVLPKAGKIVKEVAGKKFDYKELKLSNGATVVLKQTDLKKDQVLLSGEGFGGSSLYGEKDFANIKMFDDVIEASGLGNFSHTELEKALAGKIASASTLHQRQPHERQRLVDTYRRGDHAAARLPLLHQDQQGPGVVRQPDEDHRADAEEQAAAARGRVQRLAHAHPAEPQPALHVAGG